MKNITLLIALLFLNCLNSLADGLEGFESLNLSSSYTSSSFVGNNSLTWSFVKSRNANDDANESGIELPALMLHNISENSKITSSNLSGGITSFEVKLYKGFTGGGDRQVELFINGESKGVSVAFDDFEEHLFTVSDINVAGEFTLELRNITDMQIIVDDIAWTSYDDAQSDLLSIVNVIPMDGSDYEVGQSIEVSATVTGGEVGIDSVVMYYGTSLGNVDSIRLSNEDDTYTYIFTDGIVTAGTYMWYLKAFGSNGDIVSSTVAEMTGTCPVLDAPVANTATLVEASSFTANWESVTGADEYVVCVWSEAVGEAKASELFISAYVEGSRYNKYIAIYNGTSEDIILDSVYQIGLHSNGKDVSLDSLSGTINSGNTLVLQHTKADVYNGTTVVNVKCNFNGNDAICLTKNGVAIDYVGNVSSEYFGENITLYRKSTVNAPNVTYDVNEWETYGIDNVAKLGNHSMGSAIVKDTIQIDTVSATTLDVASLDQNTEYKYCLHALNQYGCESGESEIITLSTGTVTALEAHEALSSIVTLQGGIDVSVAGVQVVSVYDVSGRSVVSKTIDSRSNIALPQGIYLVKVANEVVKVAVR